VDSLARPSAVRVSQFSALARAWSLSNPISWNSFPRKPPSVSPPSVLAREHSTSTSPSDLFSQNSSPLCVHFMSSAHTFRKLPLTTTLSYITSTSDFSAIEKPSSSRRCSQVVAVHHHQPSLARIARRLRLPTGWTWMQDSGLTALTPWPNE